MERELKVLQLSGDFLTQTCSHFALIAGEAPAVPVKRLR